jgi:hypothetical protein
LVALIVSSLFSPSLHPPSLLLSFSPSLLLSFFLYFRFVLDDNLRSFFFFLFPFLSLSFSSKMRKTSFKRMKKKYFFICRHPFRVLSLPDAESFYTAHLLKWAGLLGISYKLTVLFLFLCLRFMLHFDY